MLPAERKMRLVDLVSHKKILSISELAHELGVSETTIRRDIAEVEQEGLLRRTYGGVILDKGANMEASFPDRVHENEEQKERIGRKAAELVENGDHILIDSGTTTPHLARHLIRRSNITVVTNDMNVAVELREAEGIEVIVTGGTLYKHGYLLCGSPSVEFLSTIHVQKLFVGCQAIHAKHGITQAEKDLVPAKRAMVKAAQEVIVLADDSKIGKVTLHTVAAIDEIHTFITGTEASPSQISGFTAAGVTVIQA